MSQRQLPAEVYWRRRMFVVAGAIALIWVATQLFGGGSDDADTATGPAATTAPLTPTPDPVKTSGVLKVNLPTNARACDPEQVRVTPKVPGGQFTKGPVDINLLVSTTAKKACTLTADNADLLVVISANKTAVYDSTVCNESLLDDPVVLSPDWASQVPVQWSGRGSGSGCSGKEGFATQGKYLMQVGTLGGEPGKTEFSISDKPKPKPTKTPDDEKKKPEAKGTTKPPDE